MAERLLKGGIEMKGSYFIILLCLGFGATGCADKSPTLASVRGEIITIKEFEEQLNNLPSAYRPMFTTPEQKEELLDRMVTEKLMIQEAIKTGIHRKKEIQERLKWVRNQMLMEELIRVKIYDKMVSDKEAEEFYHAHQTQLPQAFQGKPFNEIKHQLKQIMRKDDTRVRGMFNQWVEELKKEAKITKNLALLGKTEKEKSGK